MNKALIEEFQHIVEEMEKDLQKFKKMEGNMQIIKEKLQKSPDNAELLQTLKKCETAYVALNKKFKQYSERAKALKEQSNKK